MAGSSEQFWYYDQARNRQGPLTEPEFLRLIGNGTIRRDSMVWHTGMTDWLQAGLVERFARQFTAPPAAVNFPVAAASGPANALIVTLPVWGLFGRSLLVFIGAVLIIPAPWTGTAFYRYVTTHVALPDRRRLTFSGLPADIWPVLIGMAVLGVAGVAIPGGNLIATPLSWALTIPLLRWICASVSTEDGTTKLNFAGGIWNFIGWNLLFYLSFLSIIGWAWVMRGMLRWVCQNVHGTVRFDFHGTGGGILWRTLAVGFGSLLIIPIPWLCRWYATWLLSKVHAVPAAG